MNFLLRNLETHIGEAALLEGERLLDERRVDSLREVERHLWVARFGRENSVEVEIKVSPSRVLAATCECSTFRQRGECGHFAAAALALRRELTQRTARKQQPKQKAPARPAKLTTNVVLEHVDREQLTAFVREYARTHRNFAIALKARFAAQVETIPTREKFEQLLDGAIKLARRPDRSISHRGLQKIVMVLRELHEQTEEALDRHHYGDACSIAQSIVEKLPPILGKFSTTVDELERELRFAFSVFETVARSDAPPALQRELWNYAIGECSKLAYRKHGYDLLFFRLLLLLSDGPERVDQVLQALATQRQKYMEAFADPTPLLLLELRLLEEHERREEAAALIEGNLLQRGVLQYAIEYALRHQQYGRAKQLVRAGLDQQEEAGAAEWLELYQRRIAEAEGDTRTLLLLLEKQYLQHFDAALLDRLRQLQEGDWPAYLQQLTEKMRRRPPGERQRDALATLLSEAGNKEALLDMLRQSGSLDLCRQYDTFLLPKYKEEVLKLYQQLLTAYIQHHLGPKSSRKIRQVLDHLNQSGLQELSARLVQEFRTNYPERHTLMEELALF